MAGASAESKAFLELDRCSQDVKANFFTLATPPLGPIQSFAYARTYL
jgi:hypothetical protein